LVLPALVNDTSLLFEYLQRPEIDPSSESLLQYPLVPMNHSLLEVFPLKISGGLRVSPPVIEILIKIFALKVCKVLE